MSIVEFHVGEVFFTITPREGHNLIRAFYKGAIYEASEFSIPMRFESDQISLTFEKHSIWAMFGPLVVYLHFVEKCAEKK